MLLHTALQTLRELDDCLSRHTAFGVLELYFRLVSDFIRIFGKTIMQPRRDVREIFKKATQVYRSLIRPTLASLLGLNPGRLWLLPGGTI